MARHPARISFVLILLVLAARPVAADPESCLAEKDLLRVARVTSPVDGSAVHVRVVSEENGIPTAVVPIAGGDIALAEVFARARAAIPEETPVWSIPASDASARICSPIALAQTGIDAEQRVVIAAGLNYAAHAAEAGGGDVFVFPKPVAPGAPYGVVAAPAGVRLLDYEVELAFVLLEDIDLRALPSREALLDQTAFFVANDLTDREPIIVYKAFSGPGTGFVDAKGQSGFLPTGPWLVRGTELFQALQDCGGDGLALRLEVDEGTGWKTRQSATTAAMILDPSAFLRRIAEEIATAGPRTPMPRRRDGEEHFYPLAVGDPEAASLRWPAGSLFLTGTPEGIALQAPDPLAVTARGLLHLRSPFEQARLEEIARAEAGEPGGYLASGDRVRASIAGLGAQTIRIAKAGSAFELDPCSSTKGPQHDFD